MARSIRPKLATFHAGCHGSGNHQVAVVGALGVSFGCRALTALICCRMFGEVPLFRKRVKISFSVSSAASLSLASWHMLFK